MDVGVRELKAHLSEYLERASRGEVIRVTDRGQPKAVLCPVSDTEAALECGVREAWIQPGVAADPAPVERERSRRRTRDVLLEDRG